MKFRTFFITFILPLLLILLLVNSLLAETGALSQDDEQLFIPVVYNNFTGDPAGIYSNDWPADRHDSARTGHNAAEDILYPPLKPVWSKVVGESFRVQDLTAAGSDLALTGTNGPESPPKNYVLMLNTINGNKKWDFTLPNGSIGLMGVAATFDDNSVYFGGQQDTHFYAMYRADGKSKWQKSGFEDLIGSQQAVLNNTVYMPDDRVGVFALSADDGSLKWGSGYSGEASGTPVVWRDGVVYGVRSGNELVAFDAANGAEKWSYSPVNQFPWVIAGANKIFVGSGSKEFKALNARNGNLLYSKRYSGHILGVVLANERLFVMLYHQGNPGDIEIIALNTVDGEFLWNYELIDSAAGSDIVAGNGVIYFSGFGTIWALDAQNGKLIWSDQLEPSGFSGSMIIANGTLYVSHEALFPRRYLVHAYQNVK